MISNYELAEHLHGLGFSLLPLLEDKRPAVRWKRYQSERCTHGDLQHWFRDRCWRPGVVTGAVSGIAVVDCDDTEAVRMLAESGIPETSVMQSTQRGCHFVFQHPGGYVGNRQGVWGGKIDLRGDGGYVVAYPDAAEWSIDAVAGLPVLPDAFMSPAIAESAGPAGDWRRPARERLLIEFEGTDCPAIEVLY